MKNQIKTFTLFVRGDTKSENIAKNIRELNQCSEKPLEETLNGDLIIAIGGDGTFIDAVTSTNFSKEKVYAGIHTGTLGFLQNLSPEEVYALIKYLSYESEIKTRRIFIPSIIVKLKDGKKLKYNALNEVVIAGKDYSKISFSEYVNGELFQRVSANALCIATNTGDTALSRSAGGSIDFSDHFQLVRTLDMPIQNAAYERFITNPVICSDFVINLKPSNNIQIIIDGIPKDIQSEQIRKVQALLVNNSDYINKFELEEYSKAKVIREKILGYKD